MKFAADQTSLLPFVKALEGMVTLSALS